MQFYCPCLVQVGHTLHPTSSRGTHTVLLYPLTERNATCLIRICINGNATFNNRRLLQVHSYLVRKIDRYVEIYIAIFVSV